MWPQYMYCVQNWPSWIAETIGCIGFCMVSSSPVGGWFWSPTLIRLVLTGGAWIAIAEGCGFFLISGAAGIAAISSWINKKDSSRIHHTMPWL